jgi:NAD(P)-dependent dehydrogenase (short-subunit alcohol dehydrogenase family)
MAKIFITGSSDGLGQLTAKALIKNGHEVVLHARNEARARECLKDVPVLVGDLSSMEETIRLAEEVNKLGAFDAIIHNAGVYQVSEAQLFSVNTLAPYILTCLIAKPKRLIYLSSGMHLGGKFKFERVTYSDTKLHVLLLCKSVARKWPDVIANAVDPGWVPTKMGGAGAPDNLQQGFQTQTWLAEGANVSGKYFYHMKEARYNPDADDLNKQEQFLQRCADITGITFPHA